MKLKHFFIASLSIGLLTIAACKKEKDEEKQKTVAERLQAKWGFQNVALHGSANGLDSTINLPGLPQDYFDIRSDNKIYMNAYNEMDTLDYVLQNDSTLVIKDYGYYQDDAVYKIRNLTDNTLTLYTKENDPDSPGDYIEETNNLKK